MKLSQLILIGLLFFWSCGKSSPPVPKTKMVNVLLDIHIAEGLINGHHPASMKDSLQRRYLAQVLDQWELTSSSFEEAMNHMQGDPDYMGDVYDAVLAKANAYSEKLDEENPIDGKVEKSQGPKSRKILKK